MEDISAIVFFARVNTLLDENVLKPKLSKKEILLKAKPWINKNIQVLMRERNRLLKVNAMKIILPLR